VAGEDGRRLGKRPEPAVEGGFVRDTVEGTAGLPVADKGFPEAALALDGGLTVEAVGTVDIAEGGEPSERIEIVGTCRADALLIDDDEGMRCRTALEKVVPGTDQNDREAKGAKRGSDLRRLGDGRDDAPGMGAIRLSNVRRQIPLSRRRFRISRTNGRI